MAKKMKWKDVTETFSEKQRHYKDTYLEISEIYGDDIEVSLFSRDKENGDWEIYVSCGIITGISYEEEDKAYERREEMKADIEQAVSEGKIDDGDFVNTFCEKYHIAMPDDLFFDFNFEDLLKLFD